MAGQKRKRDKISDDGDGMPERKSSAIPFGSPPSILKPLPEAPSPSSNLPTLPNDIIYKIMKYCEMGTLNSCPRVSKEFYQAAGPLLYRDIEVKYGKTLWRINCGRTKVNRPASKDKPAAVNLKRQLLSYVERFIVTTHWCHGKRFHADSLPNLHTLLVIPDLYTTSVTTNGFCGSARGTFERCAILFGAQPRKVVIHNCMGHRWPMLDVVFPIRSPVLTLGLIDTSLPVRLQDPGGLCEVDQDVLEEVRIIVSRTPSYIDVHAERGELRSPRANTQALVSRILVPVLAYIKVPITVYIFRKLPKNVEGEKSLEAIEMELDKRHEESRMTGDRHHPYYTIKTLADYINEGVQDEFIWQELHYWRRVNRRRVEKEWRAQQRAQEKKQRGEQEGGQAEHKVGTTG